jgi:hypothetical protein
MTAKLWVGTNDFDLLDLGHVYLELVNLGLGHLLGHVHLEHQNLELVYLELMLI